MSHETGNRLRRIRTPRTARSAPSAIVASASGTLIVSISANASTATPHWTNTVGANARYSWTGRMSELEREISWPDCTRS